VTLRSTPILVGVNVQVRTTTDAQVAQAPPVASGPKAYIGLFGDSAIAVFDVNAKKVLKTIPVTAPDGLIITPDGKKVYVSSSDTGTVKVISTADDSLTTSVAVGPKPAGLAITPDGRSVVVAVGGADEAVVIDVASDTVTRHVPVGQAHASCISKDGHYAYVGSQVIASPGVVVVDLSGSEAPRTISVDKAPRMLACETDRIYFTAIGLDSVEVLDPATGKLDAPIPTGGSPHDVRAGQTSQTELVVSQTSGDLEFIDVPTATVKSKLSTGKLAHWITLNSDRSIAYITNEGDNNVSFVDLKSQTVADSVPVGKAPRKMAIQP
jgi:YVTN family beta-propeller protein